MLIVAMPKSASSALAAGLVNNHGLADRTSELRKAYFRSLPHHGAFLRFASQHYELGRRMNEPVFEAAADPNCLVKYHLAPIAAHQQRLHDVPKVILVRKPEDVVLAYRRGEYTDVFKRKNLDFVFCHSEAQWLDRAQRCGMLGEIALFAEQWRYHEGNKLVIDHSGLTGEPARTLNRVEEYFGLPRSETTGLPKRKYTRKRDTYAYEKQGKARIYWKRRKRIIRRLKRDARWLVTMGRIK